VIIEGILNLSANRSSDMKGKLKLSMYLTKHHFMMTYWWSRGIAPRILNLGTRGMSQTIPRFMNPQLLKFV